MRNQTELKQARAMATCIDCNKVVPMHTMEMGMCSKCADIAIDKLADHEQEIAEYYYTEEQQHNHDECMLCANTVLMPGTVCGPCLNDIQDVDACMDSAKCECCGDMLPVYVLECGHCPGCVSDAHAGE